MQLKHGALGCLIVNEQGHITRIYVEIGSCVTLKLLLSQLLAEQRKKKAEQRGQIRLH